MPIAVTCQCGKTLSVRDELAGKAVKCPSCQQVIRVAGSPKAPGTAPAKATANAPARPASPAGVARPAAPTDMDNFFEEAGFAVKTGQFCPECLKPLAPGAVLCTNCGYHLESGSRLQGYNAEIESEDGAEAALKRAEDHMRRAKELDDRLQGAGMPAWMMAMILFILGSCTAVGVIAVNVSRRGKDSDVTFNAVATMFLLAGIAFSAVFIGSYCIVIYRAFKENPKQGMFVLLIPLYVFFYAFTRFKTVGKTFIVSLVTLGAALGLFQLSANSYANTPRPSGNATQE
jgi:uncharacterized Zn finger protein (UPF0148 family)